MAHQSMSRPDPSEDPENDEPLFAQEYDAQPTDVTRLASKLAQHVGTASSNDLALDLVLHEIVEQARMATMATGAAIALFRGEEMVCRASSGSSAPDLGVRLNTRTGLSGGCVRTRQVQRCDDTETDPRVDGAALRNLDVRSILVVPIINREELAGIFEILSPRVRAFGERDVLTLQAFSQRIVRTLESVSEPPEPAWPAVAETRGEDIPPQIISGAQLLEAPVPARDYWTSVLTVIVIGLALLLGWMVGYAGWQKATAPKVIATLAPAAASGSNATLPVPPKPGPSTEPAAGPKQPLPAAKPSRGQSVTPPPPAGGLVVYQNGKLVFEMPPEKTAASAVKTAGEIDTLPVRITPEAAARLLRQRVEPEYSDAAKQAEVLGPVLLEVRVGKDGLVRQAEVVTGDRLLVPAALAAVRQWKYQPYSPEGTPLEFSTQVTVNFKGE